MAYTPRSRERTESDRSKTLRGSRFIATIAPCSSEAAARAFLEDVRAEMPDAAHHCAAWRIAVPAIDRALDAGEPSGSAGRPILAQLAGRDVVDASIVVTRYFGGVKLGVGGLVRAYGGAAAAVLDVVELVPRVVTVDVDLAHGYEDARDVERILADFGLVSSNVRYGDNILRIVEVPADPFVRDALDRALADGTAGRVRLPSHS